MLNAATPRSRVRSVPLGNLVVHEVSATSVSLRSRSHAAEIRVLAPGLIRLRIAAGRSFSNAPSWAVQKAEWPTPKAHVSHTKDQAILQTACGRFTLDLADGRWELNDQHGMVLFSSASGSTKFIGVEPHLALELQDDEHIFGLGESSGTFDKRGLIREFWNIDVGGHADAIHANLRHMYVSIPFAISLRHGRAAGLFWDNPGRQTWDLGQTDFQRWKLKAAQGELDLYLFLGPGCSEILERYTELTGRMPLPPKWGLGYHQCRYSYESRQRVEEIAESFRSRQIPCDAIYLDIHYMDGYRVFTFGKTFPKPAELAARLGSKGFKLVAIVDPGVKDDPAFAVLRRGRGKDAFVKAPGGTKDYLGRVWPGRVRFPDFLNPAARQWWSAEQRRFQLKGIAGIWNDMNEPADFSAPDKNFPADCVHQTEYGPQRHASVHNVYGSQMARASFEGALAARPGQRPFIITRAGYAGLQRHALVWTGDNDSSWEQLADSVQMLLNLSLSGVAFCGADVGGFHHNTTGELLARWTQLAALTPFFRNHSNIGTLAQEPWAFGPRVEAVCRRAIELRYQLLAYLYGLFVEAHRHGTPIMRPTFWHAQNDPAAVAASDQFLLGRNLLVAPILRQGATARSVYLPSGIWFNYWTGEKLRGGRHVLAEARLEDVPLYVRGGTILPMAPVQQFVGEVPVPVPTLHVWPGTRGHVDWYEDDGDSLDYENGSFSERRISLSAQKRSMRIQFDPVKGSFKSGVKRWRIILRNTQRAVRARVDGADVPVTFIEAWSGCAFEVPNRPDAISVRIQARGHANPRDR
ncbi:MAG: TIM-barrel domain-containing protein [Verrucomicrobiia bacterium]